MKKEKWYSIRNVSNDVSEIYINGYIGDEGDGFFAIDFIQELRSIPTRVISIYLNSYGGDIYESMIIYTALLKERERGKIINTFIDGITASVASLITVAGQTVYMGSNAIFMIHNYSELAVGEACNHEKTSELLRKIDSQIADIFVQKTGKKIEEIQALMDAETWMNADKAKEYGFINEITNSLKAAACVDTESELWKQYKNKPKNLKITKTNYPSATKEKTGKEEAK